MKKTLILIIIAVIVGAIGFYGGKKYQQSKNNFNISRRAFQNLPPEQRQQFGQRTGRIGGNFITGEIIDKDEKSLTLKLLDGSSKIILFSSSTEISKTTQSSINDLEIGKNISVVGKANSDGSITAQSIQLQLNKTIPQP